VDRIGKIEVGSCRAVLEYVLPLLAQEPCPPCEGTGIVVAAGGAYLKQCWASVRMTRKVTDLPIQVWHLGKGEVTDRDRENFEGLNVEFVDVYDHLDEHPSFAMSGWPSKSYAVAYCPFRNVLQLDADAYPLVDPMELFEGDDYRRTGSIHFQDIQKVRNNDMIFPCMGIRRPPDFKEIEVGQVLYDKARLWKALRLTVWMNSHPECFYKLSHGDTILYVIALMKFGFPFVVGDFPTWHGYGMRHALHGRPVFEHCMALKRSNAQPPEYLAELFREYDQLNQPSYAESV
jgi:hypothetical protein